MSTSAARDTTPYWADSAAIQGFPQLDRDHHVDVVVIGGGITGLTTAYLLLAAGKSVVVVERDRCGQVDTGHTTAHLTMVTDVRLTELVSRVGRDHAQAVWDAGLAGIWQIESIVRDRKLDCGFAWVDGYLHEPVDVRSEPSRLQADAELAQELGFGAEFVTSTPVTGTPGVRFDAQARFHPGRYLAGLTHAIVEAGGHIYEGSAAREFSTDPLTVTVNGRTLSCRDVVLATHTPLAGLAGFVSATLIQTKLALYTSYVVAGRVARGTVPDALYWDTAVPYHYLRVDPRGDHDVVVFGGEDHKTGQAASTAECFERLEATVRRLIPSIELTHHWSGQVIETPDGLPYIGRMTDHQYAATGFAGNGMTFGTLGAMMIADAILNRPNPWAELFDPGRAALGRSSWQYLKENADYPYYMVRDRFAGAEGRSLRAVKRGEGRVIEWKGKKVAASRDDNGLLTMRSAICPHMGCAVNWNDAERTWDCPCHGSRFKTDGEVISGPAQSPLPAIE